MTTEPLLQPTLWRTCRVLANRTRLRIFGLLVQHSPQTVSALAGRLQLSVPVACQSLRALEARGLLTARRTGRLVHYRLSTTTAGTVHELVAPLRAAFQRGPSSVNTLFRLATAFTHPRRIDIFRTLQTGAGTLRQIQAATRIPNPSLSRHLGKLEVRGFVACRGRIYSATTPPEAFGRALARVAAQGDHTLQSVE